MNLQLQDPSDRPGPDGLAPLAGSEVVWRRSDRARRYRLTLGRDGAAVVVIPWRGSEREARRFFDQNRAWLERARARQQARPRPVDVWRPGTSVLWRGAALPIQVAVEGARPMVCLGADVFRVPQLDGNLRPVLEAQFTRRARIELPARTWELAVVAGIELRRVSVRNQRARWGSCSASGTISLNWRLVQAPDFVRDYIIQHELMHLREMNHSARFWIHVEAACPEWRVAERWLRRHGSLLGL
jgi:predicted metal-dependent hydrolase